MRAQGFMPGQFPAAKKFGVHCVESPGVSVFSIFTNQIIDFYIREHPQKVSISATYVPMILWLTTISPLAMCSHEHESAHTTVRNLHVQKAAAHSNPTGSLGKVTSLRRKTQSQVSLVPPSVPPSLNGMPVTVAARG